MPGGVLCDQLHLVFDRLKRHGLSDMVALKASGFCGACCTGGDMACLSGRTPGETAARPSGNVATLYLSWGQHAGTRLDGWMKRVKRNDAPESVGRH